jgi:hypothetical protein
MSASPVILAALSSRSDFEIVNLNQGLGGGDLSSTIPRRPRLKYLVNPLQQKSAPLFGLGTSCGYR